MSEGRRLRLRLAIRTEGPWVKAYLARPHTMDGATLVATVRRSMLDAPGAFGCWKEALKKGFALMVAEVTGESVERVTMIEEAPPADA